MVSGSLPEINGILNNHVLYSPFNFIFKNITSDVLKQHMRTSSGDTWIENFYNGKCMFQKVKVKFRVSLAVDTFRSNRFSLNKTPGQNKIMFTVQLCCSAGVLCQLICFVIQAGKLLNGVNLTPGINVCCFQAATFSSLLSVSALSIIENVKAVSLLLSFECTSCCHLEGNKRSGEN